MNLLQGKSNQYLREAILEESLEKVKRYLTLKIGKADVAALTEVRTHSTYVRMYQCLSCAMLR